MYNFKSDPRPDYEFTERYCRSIIFLIQSEVSNWGNLDQKIAADSARDPTFSRKSRLVDRKNILDEQNQDVNIISDLFE